ncbi:MAG: hypothetical protein COW71_07090 [Ignavibacteriales bacterium CG18_big_fil_WC_8_21_14_2_50_31_20]|nr:MAG: hypothetical protein COW71_07090 [Ignavibacteriales bacterium CG18_big_fil_WC_8_21_14_2_50_31_20]
MKYSIEKWSIEKLLDVVENGRLLLNPPFQRNFVWSPTDQEELIESIIKGYPLPTLFIYESSKNNYEMIDGQQRTRTLLKFIKKLISDKSGKFYSEDDFPNFKSYLLPIAIITQLDSADSLEEFYYRVNNLGKSLNRPELNKAKFIKTKFLKLVEDLTQREELKKLDLFSNQTIVRMNDRDFVEEIVSLIKFDFTDKKDAVNILFKNDISDKESSNIKNKFIEILNKILILNDIFPLNKTRFRQKNDFYTLFSLIYKNTIEQNILNKFYKIIVLIGKEITPSNDNSEILREYAINCVSQSNSKSAREKRYKILKNILMNQNSSPNKEQEDIISFYLEEYEVPKIHLSLIKVEQFFTFSWEELNSFYNVEFFDVN